MRKTIIEHVHDHAVSTPEKVAVVVPGKETTYKELFHLACGYAAYLKKEGLKKGDVVVAKSSQTLEYVVIYLGVHLAGGVITSLEKSVSADIVASVARTVCAKFIINDEGSVTEQYLAVFIDSTKVLEHAMMYSLDEIKFPSEDDSADILFTTGTTGASKGVELTHKALVATAENLIYGCEYKKDTVLIVPGPLNHANPIRKLFTTLVNGSTIYILNGMSNVKAFFTALDYPCEKISCCLPPAAVRTIFQLTRDKLGDYADKIDFIESATSPLPEPDKIKLCQLLPKTRLYNNYGSSESASVCMYDYNAHPGLVGCIGKAMPNSKIIIVDDDKNVINASKNHMGLLACIGDVNMKCYINEPELTREVLQNGIVYTNDIGYIDSEGFVYISGRKGDVINVGGLKVAPTEIEAVALACEGVEDCICIPVEHPVTGQALKLLVVMDSQIPFDSKNIAKFLENRLEHFKVPQQIEQVDKIARTYNGKLDRKAYL